MYIPPDPDYNTFPENKLPVQEKKPHKCCPLDRKIGYATLGIACIVVGYTSAWTATWWAERNIVAISQAYGTVSLGAFLLGIAIGGYQERERLNLN